MSEATATTPDTTTEEAAPPAVTADGLASYFTTDAYTPYGLHKVINAILKEYGIAPIPPQMMYNYAQNGLINKVKGQKSYTKDEAIAFVVRYVTKKVANKKA